MVLPTKPDVFPNTATADWIAQALNELKTTDPAKLIIEHPDGIRFSAINAAPPAYTNPLTTQNSWLSGWQPAPTDDNNRVTDYLPYIELIDLSTFSVSDAQDFITHLQPNTPKYRVPAPAAYQATNVLLAKDDLIDAVIGSASDDLNRIPLAIDPAYSYEIAGHQVFDAGLSGTDTLIYIISALHHRIKITGHQCLQSLHITMATDQDYLVSIARLRALRLLVQAITPMPIPIYVLTSRRMLTYNDAHNNLIRQTLAAMAAVVGTADGVWIQTLDNSFEARRLAFNILLLLKHESLLDKVADPIAGSYTIESLTKAYVEEVQQRLAPYSASAPPAEALAMMTAEKKFQQWAHTYQQALTDRLKKNTQIIVGVNKYPPPQGLTPPPTAQLPAAVFYHENAYFSSNT
jgi:hypothetical protein